MTRDRWVQGAIAFVVFVLVAVGIVLIIGGDNGDNVSATATTTSSTTTSTLPPTTTTSQTSTPTVAAICATPEDAASSFVNAWIAGDQAAAARCAIAAAVTTMFQSSGTGAQYMFQGCVGDDPAAKKCGFTYEGGALVLDITGSGAAGWQIQAVNYIAD